MWSCIDYIQTFFRTQGVGGHGSEHTHVQKENYYRTIPKPATNNQFRELLDSLKWQPWDLTLMTRAWHQFLGFWVLEASWDMWQQDKWVIGLQHSGDGKQSCCCLSSVFFLSLRLGLLSTDTLLAQPVSPPLLRLAEKFMVSTLWRVPMRSPNSQALCLHFLFTSNFNSGNMQGEQSSLVHISLADTDQGWPELPAFL